MEIDKGGRPEDAADRSGQSAIEFRLDPGSGLPVSQQLVQQVEHALRLGYLPLGDRLPKVRASVASLAIPAGHVAALVGANGAGKTTLLNLAVGLVAPSAGVVTVLGGRLAGSPAALDGIAFVAQDMPLYKNLSAADMLHLTRNLNRR